jgi:hypothetical protein
MKPHTIKRPRKGKTSVRKLVFSEDLRSHEGATVRETRRLTELLATHPTLAYRTGRFFETQATVAVANEGLPDGTAEAGPNLLQDASGRSLWQSMSRSTESGRP